MSAGKSFHVLRLLTSINFFLDRPLSDVVHEVFKGRGIEEISFSLSSPLLSSSSLISSHLLSRSQIVLSPLENVRAFHDLENATQLLSWLQEFHCHPMGNMGIMWRDADVAICFFPSTVSNTFSRFSVLLFRHSSEIISIRGVHIFIFVIINRNPFPVE